jgi:hypothetical protein
MDLKNEILKLKDTVKIKIENALKNNQTETIISAAKDLDILGRLEKQHKEMEIVVNSFIQKGNFGKVYAQNAKTSKQDSRQNGKEERQIFVEEAKKRNIDLVMEKGRREVLYQNKLGGLVGIAYAYECTSDRWWLGLPIKKYQTMVLICKNEFLKTIYFIFPRIFCEKYQDKFSTDHKKAQFKFNISVKDGLYTLTIPNIEPIVINEYINKFDNISH